MILLDASDLREVNNSESTHPINQSTKDWKITSAPATIGVQTMAASVS